MFYPRKWLPLGLGFALAAGLGISRCWADGDKEDEKIEHLMEKVHEGKRSPFKTLGAQLAGNPDWQVIGQVLPPFEEMSKALRETKNKEVAELADGYAGAVRSLVKAAEKRDVAAGRQALVDLKESCADCHSKDGPGGDLDD